MMCGIGTPMAKRFENTGLPVSLVIIAIDMGDASACVGRTKADSGPKVHWCTLSKTKRIS